MRRWLNDARIGHLMPLWSCVFFVVLPWIIHLIELGNRNWSEINAQIRWAPDAMLGLMSFWVWAITTNAHSGILVNGGGTKKGTASQLRKELARIFFFALLSLVFYTACFVAKFGSYTIVLPIVDVMLAYDVLGDPER